MQCAYSFQLSTKSLKYFISMDVFVVLWKDMFTKVTMVWFYIEILMLTYVKMPWQVISAAAIVFHILYTNSKQNKVNFNKFQHFWSCFVSFLDQTYIVMGMEVIMNKRLCNTQLVFMSGSHFVLETFSHFLSLWVLNNTFRWLMMLLSD